MKGLLLISGGIDSPVAGYLMLKKGVDVSAVHCDNQPFSDEKSLNKTRQLVGILAKKFNRKIRLYIVDHGKNQAEIVRHCERKLTCVLCRRMMFRIAEKIAEREKAAFLITGENLGQVASQTLDNLALCSTAVKMIILRPILCNDKQETMDLAKEIGTYETSILPGMCCGMVPQHPATKARKDFVEEEEKKIDVNKLVEDALNSVVVEEIIRKE